MNKYVALLQGVVVGTLFAPRTAECAKLSTRQAACACPSVMQSGTSVALDDGYGNSANYAAAGLSVTSAHALARFATSFRIDASAGGVDGPLTGLPIGSATFDSVRSGDVGYASSMVRQMPSGVSYAVLTNAPSAAGSIQRQVDEVIRAAGL